jgi:hypothetical protein
VSGRTYRGSPARSHPVSRGLAELERSVVVSLVHGGSAVFPIGGGLDALLGQPAFVDEMPTRCFGGRRLRRHPGITLARRQLEPGECRQQQLWIARRRAVTMQPVRFEPRTRIETLLLGGVGDLDDDERFHRRREGTNRNRRAR